MLYIVPVRVPAGNRRHPWNSKEKGRKESFTEVAGVIDCFMATNASHPIMYSSFAAPFIQMRN